MSVQCICELRWAYRSESKLKGYLDPIGKSGFLSSSFAFFSSLSVFAGRGEALEELPALPDLTIPRFGGIDAKMLCNARSRNSKHKKA
jgi:hypothetical protein